MMRILILFLLFTFNAFAAAPEPGKEYFTVQIASFRKKEDALKVLKTVKDLPFARISYRAGRYKVRVGFFGSIQEAKDFVKKEIEGRIEDYYITKIRFSPKNVFFAEKNDFVFNENSNSSSSEEKNSSPEPENERVISDVSGDGSDKEGNGALNSTENSSESSGLELTVQENETMLETDNFCEGSSSEAEEGLENVTSSTLTKEEKSRGSSLEDSSDSNRYNYFLALVLLLFLFFGFKWRRGVPSKDLEKIVVKLAEEGKCEELMEMVLPLLSVQRENTFLRKSIADCYLKRGKLLEAASFYEEIGEILEKKGFSVLANEFREKAEKLYEKEFGRRG